MNGKNYIKADTAIPRVAAYAFFDLKDGLMSESALEEAGCRPITARVFWNDGDGYCLVLCRIRERDCGLFENAMEKLKNRMLLTGHPDYMDYCGDMIERFYEESGGRHGASEPPDEAKQAEDVTLP